MWREKKIVLGVTGSIAAYRAADLCRFLTGRNARVQVIMTEAARNFIGPSTMAGLSGNEVITDLFGPGFTHLDVAREADLIVILPATANTMAKTAAGIADSALTTTVLAADCPVIICPAMNERMWLAAATQKNVTHLNDLGYEIIGPELGELACGEFGFGRLASLSSIEAAISNRLARQEALVDKKFLVTAGPTREYFDPVRFVTNASSGKTGYAIADELVRRGGQAILISGPTSLRPPAKSEFVQITSALDMEAAVDRFFPEVDAVVMTAAVCDHRFTAVRKEKMKKADLGNKLEITENPDILKSLCARRGKQVIVGFAAQTGDLFENGRQKLDAKGLDFIVCTKVGIAEGFGADMIEAVIIDRDGALDLGQIEKKVLAREVVDRLSARLHAP